jgi:uncharacterized protein
MIIHDLPPDQCREVLARTTLCRLACARLDQPYIVPAFLYFDPTENCFYSFSVHGQKIEWMRANPKVCVEVEDIVDQGHWTTVLVFGRYEEIGDSPDDSEARRRAGELFQQRPRWWLPGAAKVTGEEAHHSLVLFRIRIDEISGRRSGR